MPVENLIEIENPDQTFKVFKGKAFNEKIHTLADTSDHYQAEKVQS